MTRCPAIAAAVVLTLALCACGEAGDPDRETAGQEQADAFSHQPAATPAQTAQAFTSSVAADNAYEIAAAKLARQKSRNDEVKRFAAQMTQDHTVASHELRDALKQTQGVTGDPRMTTLQQQELDRLRNADRNFDNAYAKDEIAAQQQALSALRDYADNGMDPALSEFAADATNLAADDLALARALP
jgi:putative membrane protein